MTQRETLWRTTGVVVPVLLGVGLGLAMPRGPLSTAQSLTGLALAVAGGVGCGWLLRSRWAALLAPALFAVAFEVVRLPASGPTVDAVRFDGGLWGLVAFITGRGFDAVVLLVPMIVGAFWGAALARRRRPATARGRRRAGRVLLVAASAVVVVFAVALARPAGTEPIRSPDGEVLEASIAEVTQVTVRGHELGMLLRGRDADLPVLLFLEGGPGGTAIGAMRYAGQGLEEHFVVATWDQRGTGTSIGAREPVETMTVADTVADTVAVAEYLRQRFGEDRIYLVGSSWGSTLGVLAVQERPDLFHAFVGTGQMVNQQETDRRMYAESVAYAERVGDEDFGRRLAAIGPPPYEDMLAYPTAITSNPDWDAYGRGPDHDSRSAYPMSLFVAEYTLTQQVRGMGALIDTFAVLYPQLQEVDFRRSATSLDVPVYVVGGAHEAPGRLVLAQEWFTMLDAPSKRMVVLEHSGHTPHLDEPGAFRDVMVDVVLAETGPG